MEPPAKKMKQSPPADADQDDFVPLGGNDEDDEELAQQFGYDSTNNGVDEVDISSAPKGPRSMPHNRAVLNDPRHDRDRPKSKHILDGHTGWLLIRTKFKRRFVHNTSTGESLWRIPAELMSAQRGLEEQERLKEEKDENARWAEDQLTAMRNLSQGKGSGSNAIKVDEGARSRRRRSESLQREDEEAMLAELAAEAERKEEEDVREVVGNVEPLKPVMQKLAEDGGYGSDSSYEEVEVTDSEGEEEDEVRPRANGAAPSDVQQEEGPVEFGEDDIAWQLAAMEGDYDDDVEQDGSANGDNGEDYGDEEAPPDDEEAAQIFREMLTDHNISPFTPWDKITSNESLILDERWVSLPNMRTRKAVWESWVRDTAAQLKVQRAEAEKLDPKVPYLEFVEKNGSVKLYWPEFKRKFKKESILSDRHLSDKEREKLYREHIRRLKLPESTRRADLINLLKAIPLRELNKDSSVEELPQSLRAKVEFISLPPATRDTIIAQHISTLPPAPENNNQGIYTDSQQAEDARRKRDEALRERELQVEQQRRKAEKEERWAKRELREEERRVGEAMTLSGRRGLGTQLKEG